MTSPTPLGPAEQNELLSQLATIALDNAPEGWLRIFAEYRAVGNYVESGAGIKWPDGRVTQLALPDAFWNLFWKLRAGMAGQETGTWISSLFRIQQPGTYEVKFNREVEPRWAANPPAAEFARELEMFPRTPENIPDWFNSRLA